MESIITNTLKHIFSFLIAGILSSQQIPHGIPLHTNFKLDSIYEYKTEVPVVLTENLIKRIDPIQFLGRKIYFFRFIFDEELAVNFRINISKVVEGMEMFFINESMGGYVGPYNKSVLYGINNGFSGLVKSNTILVELSVMNNYAGEMPIDEIRLSENFKKMTKKNDIFGKSFRRPNLNILLLGYWPPSNEAIRKFSTNQLANPDGWIGGNWEDSGYDIFSYFPSFLPPDCSSCGQGNGDFEVDYQDTSEDWWNVLDSINPVAIITFSRGFIDNSWELEWQYFNSINWIPDYTPPYQPTPTPPDSSIPFNTARYSSLPMDSIVSAIQSSGLDLNPYIDYASGAGNFLSEYMGYHGVWYKALMDSSNVPLFTAGHVHVGGLLDWETAHEAAKITLREVIKHVDAIRALPGDVNDDEIVSNLDMLLILSHILNFSQLNQVQFESANLNYDEHIDIYDLLILSEIITSF